MKHFINLTDLNKQQLIAIIENAIKLKKQYKSGVLNSSLQHKTITMIFDKPSTRTRVSFEAGATQLGAHAIFLNKNDIQLSRGEPIADSAKVISSMTDLVVMRISSHQQITEFSQNSTSPIINALSDNSHPCQILTDIMTFMELKGDITGKTIAWIGDSNNTCNTYAQAAKIFNFTLNICSPKKYTINQKFINTNTNLIDNPQDACYNADVIVTDVWLSMGQENIQQKLQDFTGYQVNTKLMSLAKKDAIFMHCLPTHRSQEVSSKVIDGKQSVVFTAAENRLHAQKSLLLYLLNA